MEKDPRDEEFEAYTVVVTRGVKMPAVKLILLVLAFVLFLLAAFGVAVPRVNFTALGLAAWVLTLLIP